MSRFRNRPPEHFALYLQIASNSRLYILQEDGPTKFIIEDIHQKQFNVSIGNRIRCSCGGGVLEHCVHIVNFFQS